MPRRYILAFLLGCTEPDRNPATYLKGSVRCQWLRGHNWNNSRRYMSRLCRRLEQRSRLCLLDYYAMGKLIHYTADAFTGAHNDRFPDCLRKHRLYERRLQCYFQKYLRRQTPCDITRPCPAMDAICAYHDAYCRIPTNIKTDSHYSVLVCSFLVRMLTS